MNKVYVPVVERDGVVTFYNDRYFTDLADCVRYINAVRYSVRDGAVIYFKTLYMAVV